MTAKYLKVNQQILCNPSLFKKYNITDSVFSSLNSLIPTQSPVLDIYAHVHVPTSVFGIISKSSGISNSFAHTCVALTVNESLTELNQHSYHQSTSGCDRSMEHTL